MKARGWFWAGVVSAVAFILLMRWSVGDFGLGTAIGNVLNGRK